MLHIVVVVGHLLRKLSVKITAAIPTLSKNIPPIQCSSIILHRASGGSAHRQSLQVFDHSPQIIRRNFPEQCSVQGKQYNIFLMKRLRLRKITLL